MLASKTRMISSILKALTLLICCFGLIIKGQVIEFIKPGPEAHLVLLSGDNGQISNSTENAHTPVLFWHGMGDTAKGSVEIDRLALERRFPGILVYSVQIGKSTVEDELAGYFSNVNDQVQQVCKSIISNEHITNLGRLNAVGFSQGAQFLRALAQRCPLGDFGIRLKNYISLGGQHQGVFGLPNCNAPVFCDYIRYMLSKGAYEKDVQEHLVQAEYWHDPVHEDHYRQKNIFLADINNENKVNETYRNRLLQLENIVLVKFEQDEMVIPRDSSHFEFYKPGQTKEILTLEDSPIYTEDRLGLKQLYEDGRLKLISVPGNHLQYQMSWFLDEIADKYLK